MSEKLNVVKFLTGFTIANMTAMWTLDDLDTIVKIISTLCAAAAGIFAAYNYYQSARLKKLEADRLEEEETINPNE